MSDLIISVSGLRGVVGKSLTREVAARYAEAFSAELPAGPLVVSHDGRESGPDFLDVIASTLESAGRKTLRAGVASTPTCGVLVRAWKAIGGIQISASHNPPEYNGMKLFSAEGRVIPAEAGRKVAARFCGMAPLSLNATAGDSHSASANLDTTSAHLALVEKIVDVERIRACRFKVLVDANRGSGSVLAAPLLAALGCQATLVGAPPDGQFEHPPEPTAENLAALAPRVRELGAAIGFCQDPDADRLALVDEQGRYIGEEYTLALAVAHVLSQTPGPIVINCSTSQMSADVAARFQVPCYRSAVGEANVVDLMLAKGATLGGEGNGGVIDPRVVLVRDSFVGMALMLDALAARRQPISALAAELPRYEIAKTKCALAPEKIPAGLAALEKHFRAADAGVQSSRLDGLRLDWPGKWLLVRASNTEPIVRAIAEAPTAAEAARLCAESQAVLSAV